MITDAIADLATLPLVEALARLDADSALADTLRRLADADAARLVSAFSSAL